MRGAALLVRFLCELGMLAAFAYWGFQAAEHLAVSVLLGLGTPLLAAVTWGMLLSPKRRIEPGVVARIVLELALFAAAAAALAAAGQPVLAVVLAVLAVTQRVVLSALGEH